MIRRCFRFHSLIPALARVLAGAVAARGQARVFASVVTLTLAVALTGCLDRGYTYATTATYDVPALGVRLTLLATGTVPPGADLSADGTVQAEVTRLGAPTIPVATLQTTNQTLRFGPGTNLTTSLPWGSLECEDSTLKFLTAIGVTNNVPGLVEELSRVLSWAALGPKSTVVGSSTNILVVKMKRDFQR